MLTSKGMIAFAIAGITAIFLSSVVPLHAMGNAVAIDISLVPSVTEVQEPVLYTDFDISAHLDPWMDIMALQLAIGVYDAQEAHANMLGMPPDFGGWLQTSTGLAFLCAGLLSMVIGLVASLDYLKRSRA